LRGLLLAVVDEYIRRHGFSARTIVSDSPVASPTKGTARNVSLASRTASTNVATRTSHTRADQSPTPAGPVPRSLKRTFHESRRDDNGTSANPPATPLQRAQTPRIEQLRHSGWMSTGRKTIDTSGGKRHDWIDQLVQVRYDCFLLGFLSRDQAIGSKLIGRASILGSYPFRHVQPL
jgi:hypothetical protein